MSKRLVIDSNVWISALVFGGTPRHIFENIVRSGDAIIMSEEISSEIRRILKQKFPSFIVDFEELLVALRLRLEFVKLCTITVNVCRDPNDNMVIETALTGGARIIITGDKDLLDLSLYSGVTMTRPQDFLC